MESNTGSSEAEVSCEKMQVSNFTEIVDDTTLHFQFIRLPKQIYAWIGCNSAKLGSLYAASPTSKHSVCATSLVGGASDTSNIGIARRLALKSKFSIILASNLPKNNLTLEVNAEKKLVEKLIELGYVQKRVGANNTKII